MIQKGKDTMKETAILLKESREQWERLVNWQASMTVRRSRPERIELPARTLVWVEGKIVGEFLTTHFLKTLRPGVLGGRSGRSAEELERYACGGPVYGWVVADLAVYPEAVEPGGIGVTELREDWELVTVEEGDLI